MASAQATDMVAAMAEVLRERRDRIGASLNALAASSYLDPGDVGDALLDYPEDVPRFENWISYPVTDEEIDASYFDRMGAWEIAIDTTNSETTPERAAELEALAEKVDAYGNKDPRPKVEQLGLAEDELYELFDYTINKSFESGRDWHLECHLKRVGRNGWTIEFEVTAGCHGEDWNVRVVPPRTREALEHPEIHARTERNFLRRADIAAEREP